MSSSLSKSKRALKIGLTGGIGAGKTLVAEVFATMGIPVFYSDSEAKNILHAHPVAIREVTHLFGNEAYIHGEPNRPYLAARIFEDAALRQRLNSIIHPLVHDAFKNWSMHHSNTPYIINEAAILFETGRYKKMDYMITVFAPKQLRINRVLQRDKSSVEEIELRMDAQWDADSKLGLADFVISNDNKQLVIPQIIQIDAHLRGIKEKE